VIVFTILKIANGNLTALVYNYSNNIKEKIAKQLLKTVEQVGFIKNNRLEMMGGELCINATLAFASQLSKKGILYTSGIKNLIKYENQANKTLIEFPLKYKQINNVILFNGIGFICIDKKDKQKISKSFLLGFSDKYGLPAFGAIVYEKNKIIPYVYVKTVNSFVKETACGSGSIAFSLFSGYKNIIQPTGKVINIRIKKDKIFVSAEVKEVLK